MDPIASKYPYWKRILHQFQKRRDIPFRRKFFVGYDLHGNTYWEFTIDGNMQRLRRKLEPYDVQLFKADYFETVPPQWLQWLRRTRYEAPTLQELINDQLRQQRIKILAQQADQKWYIEKERLEQEQQMKLDAELHRVEEKNRRFDEEEKKGKNEKEKEVGKSEMEAGGSVTGEGEERHNTDTGLKPGQADPWAQADAEKDTPVQSAVITPRK